MNDPSARHTGVCPDFAIMRVDAFSLQVVRDHPCLIVAAQGGNENHLHARELRQQRENLGTKLAKHRGRYVEWHTIFAEPPLVFSMHRARMTLEGAGWVGTDKVWVIKRVPEATMRKGFGRGGRERLSWVSRRNLAMAPGKR